MVAESQDLQNKTSRKAENIIVLRYGPDLLSEIAALAKTKRMYDAIIVDATLVGYLFPAEILIESNYLAQSILEMSGALIFLKSDKAVAMVRE